MTKDITDCAIMLEAMSGFDEKDSTSINKKKENYSKNLKDNIKGLKIGIPKEYRVDNMPKEIDELWEKGKKILKPLNKKTRPPKDRVRESIFNILSHSSLLCSKFL